MRDIARDHLLLIMKYIDAGPKIEAEPHVRDETRFALGHLDDLSDADLYDIVQRAGDAEVHCEVSPFFHTLCNLRPYYVRPGDVVVAQDPQPLRPRTGDGHDR